MSNNIDHVALHEAGHAVAAMLLLGDDAGIVTIRAAPIAHWLGQVEFARPAGLIDLRQAVISLAGPEAERLAGSAAPYAGSAKDTGDALTDVLRVTCLHHDTADLRAVLVDAVDAVDTARRMAATLVETHWEEITRGARALADAPGRVMTAPEFARAAGGAVACYGQTTATPSAPAEPGYLEIARCPECGVAAVMPGVVAGFLSHSRTVSWAAMQLRAAGCTHSAELGDVDDGYLGVVLVGMVPNGTK
jgi:hypothetical protein